ncbi:hypothetical protein ACH5RR_033180 [Cinchona calisaya]|uniref:Uncharacterized protein n=1 Tax=Cinchona calisaya TaxID=153742 RepID=A0ABD2YQI0_9GENT
MAHDIPTDSGNSLPERMTRQEQAFSQLMERLGELPAGYVLMADLHEIKAISTVLREHMRTVDATLDSLRQDFSTIRPVLAFFSAAASPKLCPVTATTCLSG